jgi:chromosome segregation ATPase
MIRLLCVFGFVAALCAGTEIKQQFSQVIEIVEEIRQGTLKDQEEQQKSCRAEKASLNSEIATLTAQIADNTDRETEATSCVEKYTALLAGAEGNRDDAIKKLDTDRGERQTKKDTLAAEIADFEKKMADLQGNEDTIKKVIEMFRGKVGNGTALDAVIGAQEAVQNDRTSLRNVHNGDFKQLTSDVTNLDREIILSRQIIKEARADIDRLTENKDDCLEKKNRATTILSEKPAEGDHKGIMAIQGARADQLSDLTDRCRVEILNRSEELKMFEDVLRELKGPSPAAFFLQVQHGSVIRLLSQQVQHMKSKDARHTIMSLIAKGDASHGLDQVLKLIEEKIEALKKQIEDEEGGQTHAKQQVEEARKDYDTATASVERERGNHAQDRMTMEAAEINLGKAQNNFKALEEELDRASENHTNEVARLNREITNLINTVNTAETAKNILEDFYNVASDKYENVSTAGTKDSVGATLIARIKSIHGDAETDLAKARSDLETSEAEWGTMSQTLNDSIDGSKADVLRLEGEVAAAQEGMIDHRDQLTANEKSAEAAKADLEAKRQRYLQTPSYDQIRKARDREIDDLKDVLVVLRRFVASE